MIFKVWLREFPLSCRGVLHSHWSRSNQARLSLVESFRVFLAPAILCHKVPARRKVFMAMAKLVLYGIRLLATEQPLGTVLDIESSTRRGVVPCLPFADDAVISLYLFPQRRIYLLYIYLQQEQSFFQVIKMHWLWTRD